MEVFLVTFKKKGNNVRNLKKKSTSGYFNLCLRCALPKGSEFLRFFGQTRLQRNCLSYGCIICIVRVGQFHKLGGIFFEVISI